MEKSPYANAIAITQQLRELFVSLGGFVFLIYATHHMEKLPTKFAKRSQCETDFHPVVIVPCHINVVLYCIFACEKSLFVGVVDIVRASVKLTILSWSRLFNV